MLALGAGVEPEVGEDPGGLLAEYGALREEPPSREHTRRLADLIAGLLQELGIEAAVRDQQPLLVVFRHEGRPFVIGVAWAGEADRPTGGQFAEAVLQYAAGASVILLSMTGFTGDAIGTASGWC